MKKQSNTTNLKITDQRRETYLSAEVAKLLIAQIGEELNNEYLYHNYSIWYDVNSYFGQAAYFMKRSIEEREHAQWIIDYLKQSDYPFQIPGTNSEFIDIYRGKADKKMDVVTPHKMTIDRKLKQLSLSLIFMKRQLKRRIISQSIG